MSEKLLSIVEVGGYPNFIPLYLRLGYEVETLNSLRKAINWLKRNRPAVVVAEFNFDPMFRDRMSNVESLLASLQKHKSDARVILFVDPERHPQLEVMLQRYQVYRVIDFPIDESRLEAAVAGD